ncbi:MAG: EAL domain-containing protein [Chloroflexi bacterium]|nr:EAL domain-containing protein [Chloroflexota bacterium]MDA1147375.1 EAL domain-containing protein [Chloroflexota bacterium]
MTQNGPEAAGPAIQALTAPRPAAPNVERRGRLANLYIWFVIISSIASTGAALIAEALAGADSSWDWPLFLALIVGVGILERAREDLFGNSRLSLSFVALFSGGLLLAPGAVGAAAMIGLFVAGFPDREDWNRFFFNVAVMTLSGVAYSTVFHIAAPPPTSGQILELLPIALGATLVAFTMNSVLVAGIVSLTGEQGVVAVWREKYAWLAPHYLAFGVAAYAMVISFLALGTIGAAIFAMPVVMLWFAVRQYTDRTRATTVELQRANRALGHSEMRYRALVQNAPGVTIVLNPDHTIQYMSSPIGGLAAESTTIGDLVHPRDLEAVNEAIRATSAHPDLEPMLELKMPDAHGQWRDYEATMTNLVAQAAVGGVVINARDVTDRKTLENELRHQAFHDPLTNLPNRALFLERLEDALAMTQRTGGRTAVMFIDLDRFKVVNDSLGHNVGDELLIALAERLNATAPEGAMVARFGGDEFTLLVPRVENQETLTALAHHLLGELRGPVKLMGHNTIVTASIGISMSGERAKTPRELIRSADIALSHAKEQGRSRYVLFDETLDKFSIDRLRLESELRQAVERDQLRLHYQPEIDLPSGEIVGFEALVRWNHPTRGLVPPAEFITLAEETGEIISIGKWVLHEACRQAAEWRDSLFHGQPFTMAVNLSANEFLEPGLAWEVLRVLRETGLEPRALRIEITESVLLDDSAVTNDIFLELKRIGVELAIDDFGTGYSSLSYLRQLPADVLKIDRSFVSDVDHDDREASIVRAVVRVAEALGMRVVADGIEREEQAHFLAQIGCESGQGYYFARPAEAAITAELVRNHIPQERLAS